MNITPQVLISPIFLGIILGIIVVVFVALSFAFMYHWKHYGMDTRLIKSAPAIYFSVSFFLFLVVILSYLATL